jgi:hypothetical protein
MKNIIFIILLALFVESVSADSQYTEILVPVAGENSDDISGNSTTYVPASLNFVVCSTSKNITPGNGPGMVCVHYTNANLATVIDEFAEAVDISISYNKADVQYSRCNLRLNNIPWDIAFEIMTKPYGLTINQIQNENDPTISRIEDTNLLKRDKPFYLLPEKKEITTDNEDNLIEGIKKLLNERKARGRSNIIFLPAVFIIALFRIGLPYHWAAKTLRTKDSTIGKGIFIAFLSIILGIVFCFLPDITGTILGLVLIFLLVKKVYRVSVGKSISIILLSAVYDILLSLILIAIAIGVWFLLLRFGIMIPLDISI